jgi:hypothetical protein
MAWTRTAALVASTAIALAGCDQCGASDQAGGGQQLVFTGPAAGTLTY